jgi:hypothetical protein
MLARVDARFREVAPTAPAHLDPNNPAHAGLVQQWYAAHHEVLSKMTDEVFVSFYPHSPASLDPTDPAAATLIEYWKDIAAQIDSGRPGRYDWSGAATSAAADAAESEEIEMPLQDGSVQLDSGIRNVMLLTENYVDAVAATPLAAKAAMHVAKQIETLRGLVQDGTFQTYDHWWRSPSYSEVLYDEDGKSEEHAFVRDLTLEAKIDRTTGILDLHVAGWATDFRAHNSFGRVSMAGG